MTRDRPQGFERLGFMVVEGTNYLVDRAAERAGLDRSEFLQRAIAIAIDRPSERSQTENKGPSTCQI